ncbi:MAG: triacylglycerol lipase [Myxococcota bacterium]|nr:triacylglycerol lipase [Myxococcota bacterium]
MLPRRSRSPRSPATTALLAGLALGLLTGCPPDDPPPPAGNNDYPILLAHGFLGTETYELGGLEILDYWFGIVSAMESEGADVFVTQVSPVNSSYVRGAQLVTQIEDILAQTGEAKVHLIGHSQGGLDARYAAGMRPDLVRSVTTVATPHKGADLADFISDNIDSNGNILSGLLTLFGNVLEDFARLITGSTDPLDWKAGFENLSDVSQFNSDFPDGLPAGCSDGPSETGGVRHYSWTGDIVGFLGVRISTNALDPSDVLFTTASLFYGLFEDNDGLVTVCSSQFGEVIGDDYQMNHLDEVNQIIGLVSLLESNPKTLFRNHVGRLLDLAP